MQQRTSNVYRDGVSRPHIDTRRMQTSARPLLPTTQWTRQHPRLHRRQDGRLGEAHRRDAEGYVRQRTDRDVSFGSASSQRQPDVRPTDRHGLPWPHRCSVDLLSRKNRKRKGIGIAETARWAYRALTTSLTVRFSFSSRALELSGS